MKKSSILFALCLTSLSFANEIEFAEPSHEIKTYTVVEAKDVPVKISYQKILKRAEDSFRTVVAPLGGFNSLQMFSTDMPVANIELDFVMQEMVGQKYNNMPIKSFNINNVNLPSKIKGKDCSIDVFTRKDGTAGLFLNLEGNLKEKYSAIRFPKEELNFHEKALKYSAIDCAEKLLRDNSHMLKILVGVDLELYKEVKLDSSSKDNKQNASSPGAVRN